LSGKISAQKNDSTKNKVVHGFYSGETYVNGDLTKLNDVITPLGYPSLQNNYHGWSFGITRRESGKKSYSTTNFSYLESNPSVLFDATRLKDARLRIYELYAGRTFDLTNHPRWLVYPYFGIGVAYGRLILFSDLNQQSFTGSVFNLSSPTTKTWSSLYLIYDAGFGVERKFRIWVYDFSAGVSGGYRLTTSHFTDEYGSNSNAVPIHLRGITWSFKLRVEIFRWPAKHK
jgi:hypothetical protein